MGIFSRRKNEPEDEYGFARSVGEIKTFQDAVPLLRSIVMPATFGDEIAGDTPISRPALPFLREYVVLYFPDGYVHLNRKMLADWGFADDVEVVFEISQAFMRTIGEQMLTQPAPRTRPALIEVGDPSNSFGSSNLITQGWLAAATEVLGAPTVAFLPAPGMCTLAIGFNESMMPDLFAHVLGKYQRAEVKLSPCVYTAVEGEVVAYRGEPGSAAWKAARFADVRLAIDSYSRQAERLEQAYADDDDVFIASLTGYVDDTDTARTVATWTHYIPTTLLPKADEINFVIVDDDGTGGILFCADWDVVAAHIDLTPVDGIDPPRYAVGAHPDATVMNRLAALAKPEEIPPHLRYSPTPD